MKLLEERIRKDGKVFPGDILKVDSFLNHQVDIKLMDEIGKDVTTLTTNDIRYYLANYQMQRQISTVTLDNMRCIYNSFFKFLDIFFCKHYY